LTLPAQRVVSLKRASAQWTRPPQIRNQKSQIRNASVGRVVLESTSPGLQPGAKPSQLPTPVQFQRETPRQKPDVAV